MPAIAIQILYYLFIFALLLFLALLYSTIIANLLFITPFVPTRNKTVKHIAKLANLKQGEKVYDLGCGDGRFLIEAQKYTKTTATGFEIATIPYLLAKIRKFITKADIKILLQNFFKHNLSDANVIFCYLGPKPMAQIAPKLIAECKPGTRIYSNTFAIKTLPKQVWEKDRKEKLPKIFMYEI